MKMKNIKTIIVLISILILNSGFHKTYAQEFGFGCLGFVGGFAGYQSMAYKPVNFNAYINDFNETRKDSLTENLSSFGAASGFQFGLNFLRHNYDGLIITFKGSYSKLNKKNSAAFLSNNLTFSHYYDIKLSNFTLGLDLGTTLSSYLDWKVIDASILFNQTALERTQNSPNVQSVIDTYKAENISIGYILGTGFILKLIADYVSLEGSIGYSFFSVGKMKNENLGTYLNSTEKSSTPMEEFISAGGLNATIQLNLSFPL